MGYAIKNLDTPHQNLEKIRNNEIRVLAFWGVEAEEMAIMFDLSKRRIYQIIGEDDD